MRPKIRKRLGEVQEGGPVQDYPIHLLNMPDKTRFVELAYFFILLNVPESLKYLSFAFFTLSSAA